MTRFFCFVYGEAFLDLFERIAIRSLTQRLNRAAVPSDAVVALYSNAESMARACQLAAVLGHVEPHVVDTDGLTADVQNAVFLAEVERCFAQRATMIVAGPENFWGDGSLANLIAIAGEQQVCVAAPHIRVDKNHFLQILPQGEISNPQLVAIAFDALHPSWINADASLPMTSSYYAGISYRKLSPAIYSVTHRLPTCWLARFTAEDMAFFRSQKGARGLWDHAWPQILIRSERQRLIGSSDALFIAELTDANTHNVPLVNCNPQCPDAFAHPSLHAHVNRNTTAIWRAEI